MNRILQYTVHFEQDEDGIFIATVPVLRGCHSFGSTLEEAEKNIQEAILCYLEGLEKVGEEIPIEAETHAALDKPIQVSLSTA